MVNELCKEKFPTALQRFIFGNHIKLLGEILYEPDAETNGLHVYKFQLSK